MKTSTLLAALCLGLVFLISITVFAGGIDTRGNGTANASIRYAVNVQYSGPEKPLSVVYMVQILNENHKLVAPAQMLLPGKSQYSFFEKGPADGIRIAVIVKAALGMGASEPIVTLLTDPCVVKGPFEVGHTYRFDLFPKLVGDRK